MAGKRWPHVRAGAIALAIVIGLVDGCPIPPPQYTLPWQKPIVDMIRPVQHAVLLPFAWIGRGLAITQRWALFQVAPRDRYRLEVQGKGADGQWQLLFRAGDPEHAAYADLLMDERVRGGWKPDDRPPRQLGTFAPWFLGRVLADHPELVAARMWYQRVQIGDGEVHDTGVYVMPFERAR